MVAPNLTPYFKQENSVRNDFAAKSAANTFSRTLAQKRGSREIFDFKTSFNRQLPSFTSNFTRRGLAGGGIQSGVYKQAMRNRLSDYGRNLGTMQGNLADDMRQYDFNQSRFQAERDNALAQIAAEKAALIAQTAAQVQGLRY